MLSRIKSLKITTVAENLVQTMDLVGQWGLAFYIELIDAKGDERKILLDTGFIKDAFLHNIEKLKIDLSSIDGIVLSHGHLDHTCAIVEAVEAAGGVPVYAHPHCFHTRLWENKKGVRMDVGVPKGQGIAEIEQAGGKVVLSKDPVEVVPGFWTTGEVPMRSFETRGLVEGEKRILVVDGEEIDDLLLDDLALWGVVENYGLFVVTGCAHTGIVNTLLQAQQLSGSEKLYGFTGGTHLIEKTDEYLNQTFESLKGFGMEIMSACHCTGFKATSMLFQRFPEEFVLNYCGRVIEVGKTPEPKLI